MAVASAARANRLRYIMAAVVTVTLIAVLFAWRVFRAPGDALTPAPSLADLDALAPYLTPMADSAHLAPRGADTMVPVQDPFAVTAVARAVEAKPEAAGAPELQPTPDSSWVVYGVLISEHYRSAFINESLVKLGDEFDGGMRLTSVEKNYVVLTDAKGRRHTIAFPQGGKR